jgi:predicted ABC-type ATPase
LETTLSGNLIFQQIDHAKDQGFLIHLALADRVDVYTNTSKCESIVQIEQGKIISQATKKLLWIAEILKQY